MKRLRECINEGFLKTSYEAYKRKVLDALSSVGILIDSNKMNRAEEWIKDFYDDEMSAYDCANSLRADLARSAPSVTEAFERYATELVDSAPSSKRKEAFDSIKSMDNIQKAHFDQCVLGVAKKKNMDPKSVVGAHGYDIMEMIRSGAQSPSKIIDSVSRQQETMSLEEALEIIRESGKRIDEGNEILPGRYLCTKGFTHGNMGTLFKRGREYDVKEIRDDGDVLVGGFWVSPDFFIEHFMPLN